MITRQITIESPDAERTNVTFVITSGEPQAVAISVMTGAVGEEDIVTCKAGVQGIVAIANALGQAASESSVIHPDADADAVAPEPPTLKVVK